MRMYPRFSTLSNVRMPLMSVLIGIQTQSALAGLTLRMRNTSEFGVVCADWGNVRAAPLAYSLA